MVQLHLCIHRNNACFCVVFACLLLLPSPEAHIKWFLHVVSEEAVKSRVGNVRAFAGDLHAFGLFFDLSLGRGSNIVQLSISEREGLIGEVSGKLVGRNLHQLGRAVVTDKRISGMCNK